MNGSVCVTGTPGGDANQESTHIGRKSVRILFSQSYLFDLGPEINKLISRRRARRVYMYVSCCAIV